MKISTELLSEVLKLSVKKHSLLNKQSNMINITYYPHDTLIYTDYMPINIYQLAHKCKVWALEQGYSVMSRTRLFGGWVCELMTDYGVEDIQFDADTEPEAVFKACQWILDNK